MQRSGEKKREERGEERKKRGEGRGGEMDEGDVNVHL